MKLLMLTRYDRMAASSRLRSIQYIPYFERSGIKCTHSPLITNEMLGFRYINGRYPFTQLVCAYLYRCIMLFNAFKFDLIWIEKEALPWIPGWVEAFLLRRKKYVLDFDDAVFHYYDQHPSRIVRFFFGRRIDNLMKRASLVVVGNSYLADRARGSGAHIVDIFPTVLDISRYSPKNWNESSSRVASIVWIGSPSTAKYLSLLQEPLSFLSKKYKFKVRIIGGGKFNLGEIDTEFLEWNESTEAELIEACDIGVMPLFDSSWEKGKCGYKLIQYMACALPVIASPVGVNVDIVKVGFNGFLASSTTQWIETIELLLNDFCLRKKMGIHGRVLAETKYSLQSVSEQVSSRLKSI